MATNTIPNRTIFIRDNLEVMRGMNSESVDLIYLDPPFNSGQEWSAPVGSKAAGAAFKDAWTLDDVKEERVEEIEEANPALHHIVIAAGFTHSESMQGYLTYMAIRLLEMRRILKLTGSVYLHCDPTASHYLKAVMDAVFGRTNFRNEVAWGKYGGHKNTASRKFTTQHDSLLFYSFEDAVFNPVYLLLAEATIKAEYKHVDESGRRYAIPRGRKFREGIIKRVYLDENPGVAAGTLWVGQGLTMQGRDNQRTGYPTQKPLALLERIVKASSNEGDMVLDPFCGCATTCVAAEKLGREWIGIDLSEKAYDLVVQRLAKKSRWAAPSVRR